MVNCLQDSRHLLANSAAQAIPLLDDPEISGQLESPSSLAAVAFSLGAEAVAGISDAELNLRVTSKPVSIELCERLAEAIVSGKDPLGSALLSHRSAEARRRIGAVYTPPNVVEYMLRWTQRMGSPERVVDPGSGTALFLREAAKRFPGASLVGVELDPLSALLSRANLAVSGVADRSMILVEDFRSTALPQIDGRTLYVGNPPYVRHHLIEPRWKQWLKETSLELGVSASALAGLHVYFFLAIARAADEGDYGAIITAAEWLDVNYGQIVRELFLGPLGGESVAIFSPQAAPFPGVATTAAITAFEVGKKPKSARFISIGKPNGAVEPCSQVEVGREQLENATKWSWFSRETPSKPAGYIELGDLCVVHRGQVTGANRVWIEGLHSSRLPAETLFPTVTRAKDLFESGIELAPTKTLRRVIDLPPDLSAFCPDDLRVIGEFLDWAQKMGARDSYVARHRKVWWSVGLRQPAPIIASYMARRPPVFVLNPLGARHLNIAHGIYPREHLDQAISLKLVKFLRANAGLKGGRVYAGGLTKFEPREMERILVPGPNLLRQMQE